MGLGSTTTSVEGQADAEMSDSTHFGAQGLASGQQASDAEFQTSGNAAQESEGEATAEYDPFEFVPSARLQRMQLLLAGGDPSAPVLLLVGFYSHSLIARYESDGFEVIACDYRAPEGPSMFYTVATSATSSLHDGGAASWLARRAKISHGLRQAHSRKSETTADNGMGCRSQYSFGARRPTQFSWKPPGPN